jgi:hypothetical protein
MAAPATRRINRGRGHSYLMDGQKVDGVTTIIGDGFPKPALVGWAAKVIAEFVANRVHLRDDDVWDAARLIRDLRAIAAENRRDAWPDGPPGPLSIAEILKGLHWRDRDLAGNRGTEVHKLAERLARGEEVDVPEELVGHVDSYLKFRKDWDPQDELVEVTVGNYKHRYMGTADLFANLESLGYCEVDIKTGRSGIFGETALQLAAYRYCDFYLDADGNEQPMPEFDNVVGLWLRADGYDLYPIEAGPAEWRTFLYVQQVAHFQTSRSKEVIGAALTAPDAAAVAS